MSDDNNQVATFKERVYTRAVELSRGIGRENDVRRYLEELGLAPTVRFEVRDGETVESLNTAVFAKLEELGYTQYADELGLERPGTQEVTVTLTVRLSPDEASMLHDAGASEVRILGKRPVSVTVASGAEPTEA